MPLPLRSAVVLLLAAGLAGSCAGEGCGGAIDPPDASTPDSGVPISLRCPMPLEIFREDRAAAGSGAYVRQVASAGDLIGGPTAAGRIGDWLIGNDKVRLIVQGEGRAIGPHPYGGTLLDADTVHAGPGNDQLGEIGLIYNFSRTIDPQLFEIVEDGSDGGPAILAISGPDEANDYLAVRNHLKGQLGTLPEVDPYAPVPVTITNYFVLQPGEQRVQVHTAFCNTSDSEVTILAGELTDPGEGLEFFNGQSCTNGFGFGGTCQGLDRMSWNGLLGSGVAYGYAPWTPGAPTRPGRANVTMTIAGITVTLGGVAGIDGLLQWFNRELTQRSGELRLPPRGSRVWARDFYIGTELGELSTLIARTRAAADRQRLGILRGRVTVDGVPLAGARVNVARPDEIATVFTTRADGTFEGEFPEGDHSLTAWAQGHQPTSGRAITLRHDLPVEVELQLVAARRLTVRARDLEGQPIPAKVTVLCASGQCGASASELNRFIQVGKDALPAGVQDVRFIPPSGELELTLPAGRYHVLVSRGPEYSLFPNDYPSSPGELVDLRTVDATVTATLARVVDTTGWISADFHVHSVNSPDSTINNTERVLNFVAEGVDVLVATDHDVITDFAPIVRSVGAEGLLSTVMGEEVSTMDFGHYNLFPLTRDPEDLQTGGALDWAGGRGPTLSPKLLVEEARRMGASTVHLNHPRSGVGGSFAMMQVDLDTMATHADPADFRMAPEPGATAEDTRLFGTDFNAYEVLNAAEDEFLPSIYHTHFNDWFTLLSRGFRVAGTGVSDTHTATVRGGGYYRTWVQTGSDDPVRFSPHALSEGLNALKATAGAGPFVTATAVRVNASGTVTSEVAGMGGVLDVSGDAVELTLRIQAPEYLDVTRIELYMHQPQDDARCPVPSDHPNALTHRVSCNGQAQHNWPESGITATRAITLDARHLVPVTSKDGVTYRRWELEERFRLPAPTRDNWVVAMVYGSRSLFPLVMLRPGSGTLDPTPGFAFTNPIFIDADGNGYDRPPFDPDAIGSARHQPPPPVEALPGATLAVPLTRERLLEGFREIRGHH